MNKYKWNTQALVNPQLILGASVISFNLTISSKIFDECLFSLLPFLTVFILMKTTPSLPGASLMYLTAGVSPGLMIP